MSHTKRAAQLQMGQTDGEMQGWQPFAQGIAQALRNVNADRRYVRHYARQNRGSHTGLNR
jgi:hypothetical protein